MHKRESECGSAAAASKNSLLTRTEKKKKKKKTAKQSEKSGVIKKNAKMECKLQEMTASKRKNIARAKNGVHKQ